MARFIVKTEKQSGNRCLYETYQVAVMEMDESIAAKASSFSPNAPGVVRVVHFWNNTKKTGLDHCQYRLVLARAETLATALNGLARTPLGVTLDKERELKAILLDLSMDDLERFRFVVIKGGHGDRFACAGIRRGQCVYIGMLPREEYSKRSQIWADWSAENGRYHGHQ